MKRSAVIQKIQKIIADQGSQKGAAEVLGISEQYLSDILRHRRAPGKKILDKLRLKSSVVYTPK